VSIAGLPLLAPTSPAWIAAATGDLTALLIDHAHCELKAAANAMALAGRHAERTALVRDLTALAREELRHFDQAHARVRARGAALTPPQPDLYVKRLQGFVRGEGKDTRTAACFADLVICGFIEARSCERFRLLAGADSLPAALRDFYAELAQAEARHHELFFGHALEAGGPTAEARIHKTAAVEAEIVVGLPLGPRIH
jgi:tRNA 2-(methylsulfanyl)-N6-isopentenyladenosine37 hydroxylase